MHWSCIEVIEQTLQQNPAVTKEAAKLVDAEEAKTSKDTLIRHHPGPTQSTTHPL